MSASTRQITDNIEFEHQSRRCNGNRRVMKGHYAELQQPEEPGTSIQSFYFDGYLKKNWKDFSKNRSMVSIRNERRELRSLAILLMVQTSAKQNRR